VDYTIKLGMISKRSLLLFSPQKSKQNKGTAFAKQNVSLEKALATASSPMDSQKRANKSLKTENSLCSNSSVFLTRFIFSFLALQVLRNWMECCLLE